MASQALTALQTEKLKTQKQMTERLRLENAMTRGELLRKSEVAKAFAVIADAISTRIMSATELPRIVREDLLREISTWPLALEEATHAQTRIKAADNAQGQGQDPSLLS
jgi:hypothetical protein